MIPIEKIYQAKKILSPKIIRTPLIHSPILSKFFNCNIFLKLENLQKTGSFKIRGATYKLLNALNKTGNSGVVAASAGNHAQGVAMAARKAGIPATIIMPEWASITKQEATHALGGHIILHGQSIGESLEKAKELVLEGKTFIHPFDDTDIITGQATVAMEIFEDLKDPDIIIAPVGGGGLISGISSVMKITCPKTKIIGVQAALCPSAYESFKKNRIIQTPSKPSIADGINVKQVGRLTFDIIQKFVDEIVLVKEEDIASAILMLLEKTKTLAEGAGAAPLAALLNGSVATSTNKKIVLVISGGNVDSPLLGRVIDQGLIKNKRVIRFRVYLDDIPGSLSKLLEHVACFKANVLNIYHFRNIGNMPIYASKVELELETRGTDHIEEIINKLRKAGYKLELM